MSEASGSEKILSEDYADLILPVTLRGSYFLNAYEQMGRCRFLVIGSGMIHIPLSMLPRDLLAYVGYYSIPKLYTLLDRKQSGSFRDPARPLPTTPWLYGTGSHPRLSGYGHQLYPACFPAL